MPSWPDTPPLTARRRQRLTASSPTRPRRSPGCDRHPRRCPSHLRARPCTRGGARASCGDARPVPRRPRRRPPLRHRPPRRPPPPGLPPPRTCRHHRDCRHHWDYGGAAGSAVPGGGGAPEGARADAGLAATPASRSARPGLAPGDPSWPPDHSAGTRWLRTGSPGRARSLRPHQPAGSRAILVACPLGGLVPRHAERASAAASEPAAAASAAPRGGQASTRGAGRAHPLGLRAGRLAARPPRYAVRAARPPPPGPQAPSRTATCCARSARRPSILTAAASTRRSGGWPSTAAPLPRGTLSGTRRRNSEI